MNILDAEDLIKGLPDDALTQEAQAPSGQVPQFLVISEIQRRTDMRKRYENDQQQNQGTVAEQIVQEGIAGMMPQQPVGMPPQGMPQGMPPQGMPPQMPPQMPQGMPPQMPPQGMPPQMPQGMPPMGMAQGGIVQMQAGKQVPYPALDSFVAGANVGPMQGGSTIKDQLDRAIGLGATYPEMVSFIENSFTKDLRDQARAYLTSKMQEAMPPTTMGANTRPMPSDISDMDMAFIANDRAKDQVAADIGSRFNYFQPPEFIGDAIEAFRNIKIPDIGGAIGSASDYLGQAEMPARARQSEALAGIDFGSALEGISEIPAVNKLGKIGGGIADMFGAIGDSVSASASNAPLAQLIAASEQSAQRDPDRYTRTEAKPGQEPADSPIAETLPLVQEKQVDASDPRASADFSVMDDYFGSNPFTKPAGGKEVQSVSKIQQQSLPSELGFADLIADSRRMAGSNALMQLGAGIAGGNLSQGISAAGMAANKGMQDARSLEMKERLAKYQAGREDAARAEKADQFTKTFGLSAKRIEALIQDNADKNQREALRGITTLYEKAYGPAKQGYARRIRQIVASLLGETPDYGAPMMGAGTPVDFNSIRKG